MAMTLSKKEQEELIQKHKEALWKKLGFSDMDKRRKLFEELEADIWQNATAANKPSAILKKKYQKLMDCFVPKEKQPELMYIIDKSCEFTFTVGYSRRSVRTKSRWYIDSWTLSNIFEGYYNMTFYGKNMLEYCQNTEYRLSLESVVGSYTSPGVNKAGYLYAAELDKGNTKLAEALEDILMSENNTNIVTPEIINGILKSDNIHLHKIVGDFLLAAKLQEGVRQVVCETMDQGTTAAFLTLFDVIWENDLVRFSAVKRAISTWTGICDVENMERITGKQLKIMKQALQDKAYLQKILQSNDSIELYIGLWAQGFYEVEDAIASCQSLLAEGTKNQKLVVSYYNRSLQRPYLTGRAANQVLETYPEDIELCASFLPTYMPNLNNICLQALYGNRDEFGYYHSNKEKEYKDVKYSVYFESEEQARKHFMLLKQLREAVPKKGREYSPCIFPWYSVEITPSMLVAPMAMIAYMLKDDTLIDEVCVLLSEIKEIYERCRYLCLLLHKPQTVVQRRALLEALADKAPDMRKDAFELVQKLDLSNEEYVQIQGYLKYKASDIRKNVLSLLEGQQDATLKSTIEAALKDKKEEVRLGGLDLVVRLKKNEKRQSLFQDIVKLLALVENPSEKEAVILKELTGESQADNVLKERGYGLYDPDAPMHLPECQVDAKLYRTVMKPDSKQSLHNLMLKLSALYEKNQNREYKTAWGEERLLGEYFVMTTLGECESLMDKYPFPELWRSFYEEEIQNFEMLIRLKVYCASLSLPLYQRERYDYFEPLLEKLCGAEYLEGCKFSYKYNGYICHIINILFESYSTRPENQQILYAMGFSLLAALRELPKRQGIYEEQQRFSNKIQIHYVTNQEYFTPFIEKIKSWSTHEEFDKMFLLSLRLNDYYGGNAAGLTFLHYVKAYLRKLITLDNVYQAAFEYLGLGEALQSVRALLTGERTERIYANYLKLDGDLKENTVLQTAEEIYWNITEMILKVELKRSETPTPFSEVVCKISKIQGCAHLLDILTALGSDTLERSVYYSYYGNGRTDKKTCLCHLLHVSEPLPGENGETLKKLMKERRISEKRLVEAAMYNTKWIDCVEEYLGWSGLKSGVYYFVAHMNENFSDKTAAIIAKYTPLSKEELNDGAFDMNWFLECSEQLGEKRFKMLYDGAKYISDSNKHTRGRKYADAVQGKVNAKELEQTIVEKRNKDLLMSYPLVPLENEADTVHRYQFLQKFLKESKQFGAQRRASEAKAVEMGLQNLATRSGYADVTRLTLNMETKLVEEMQEFFAWQAAEELQVKIAVDEDGKPAVICEKDGKTLKNIPAKLKKNEQIIAIKEVCSQLKAQYTRAKAMMEQFMEDCVELSVAELQNLQKNPIIRPILKNLVYIAEEKNGFVESNRMTDSEGVTCELAPEVLVRIAHPFDLWKLGVWQAYQKLLFERQEKQPFKQVFRELYVKTAEELDRHNSLRYAGNQIQPQKTVGCLKSRRWVADYEDGLQKIYYKENIVARIYALADWFAPSDVEAPTLEWVEFSDRKTFQPIAIKDVPDYIFSEVMRDVDLAVSVAHVGGVDPETSHSTMEMRKAIVEFNLPLFGLTNVTFAGNHAVIEGQRASYTVHLGSGVVFKRGGTQIAVLPVHSQHRGKLFLPFVDEDPKTAEIMSKIVLFAEDLKIKDPYILQQIG